MLNDVLTAARAAAVLGLALWATDAYAQETASFGTPTENLPALSTVTLGPSDMPGALAQVTFHNEPVNNNADTGQAARLDFNGLTVLVEFAYNVAPGGIDRITIIPPDGVYCLPKCEIELLEDFFGSVTLHSGIGVGM